MLLIKGTKGFIGKELSIGFGKVASLVTLIRAVSSNDWGTKA